MPHHVLGERYLCACPAISSAGLSIVDMAFLLIRKGYLHGFTFSLFTMSLNFMSIIPVNALNNSVIQYIHIAKLRKKKKKKKLGLRECKQLGQSYAVSKWQSQCSKPDTSEFRAHGLSGRHMVSR